MTFWSVLVVLFAIRGVAKNKKNCVSFYQTTRRAVKLSDVILIIWIQSVDYASAGCIIIFITKDTIWHVFCIIKVECEIYLGFIEKIDNENIDFHASRDASYIWYVY